VFSALSKDDPTFHLQSLIGSAKKLPSDLESFVTATHDSRLVKTVVGASRRRCEAMERSVVMLRRFDPWREIAGLRNSLERMFEDRFEPSSFDAETGSMPLDIYDEGEFTVVKAAIPGFKPEEIKIELREDLLTITAERKTETESKDRKYHVREQRMARASRSVVLPNVVVADKAEAVFDNGVLTLSVPKASVQNAKIVPIKTSTALKG
jgi:HSP20 family protein